MTCERNPAVCSSDEEEDDSSAILYIPVIPEVEDSEEAEWLNTYFPELSPGMNIPEMPPNSSNPKRPKGKKNPANSKKVKTEPVLAETGNSKA